MCCVQCQSGVPTQWMLTAEAMWVVCLRASAPNLTSKGLGSAAIQSPHGLGSMLLNLYDCSFVIVVQKNNKKIRVWVGVNWTELERTCGWVVAGEECLSWRHWWIELKKKYSNKLGESMVLDLKGTKTVELEFESVIGVKDNLLSRLMSRSTVSLTWVL